MIQALPVAGLTEGLRDGLRVGFEAVHVVGLLLLYLHIWPSTHFAKY
jgi:hypothetical protein